MAFGDRSIFIYAPSDISTNDLSLAFLVLEIALWI